MSNKRRFTTEYKEEIIKLVTEQGKRVTHVARDIGVSEATVRGWVKNILNMEKMYFQVVESLDRKTKK